MQLKESSNLVKLSLWINFVSSDDPTRLNRGWKIANMEYSLYGGMKKKEERKKHINLNSQGKIKRVKTIKC